MNRFRQTIMSGRCARQILGALFLCAMVPWSFAAESAPASEGATGNEPANGAKNLARMNCGAKIDCITPDGRLSAVPTASEENKSASALIMDDDTLSCPLQEGETTFVISFPKTFLLDRFTFLNENAAAQGELKIAVSNYQLPAASSKWTDVDGSIAFSHKRLFNLSMVGVEARYVKLSFHVEKGGRIAALGLYGNQSLQTFAVRQRGVSRIPDTVATTARIEDMLNFNFANLYAKARIVFVSSGAPAQARQMIDEDTRTAFQFAPFDQHPTVIVELAERERLHRVSALYKMEMGRVDVYLLNALGANPGDLSGAKPIGSVVDKNGHGKAAVDFDPQGARYVALRWTPAQAGADRSFDVAEVHAFGDVPLSVLDLNLVPDVYASNSASLHLPTTPTEPPFIPVVSP